jgi:hypothetical protein
MKHKTLSFVDDLLGRQQFQMWAEMSRSQFLLVMPRKQCRIEDEGGDAEMEERIWS